MVLAVISTLNLWNHLNATLDKNLLEQTNAMTPARKIENSDQNLPLWTKAFFGRHLTKLNLNALRKLSRNFVDLAAILNTPLGNL
jgi:hypothetical protein